MRGTLLLCILALLCEALFAQTPKKIYIIPADSVLMSYCDSTELILENHTQNVPGFLYNTGRGRTIFKRGAEKISDSQYIVGADTVNIPVQMMNYWKTDAVNLGSDTLFFGGDQSVRFCSGGYERMRLFQSGDLVIGAPVDDGSYRLQVNGQLSAYGPYNVFGKNLAFANNSEVFFAGLAGIRVDSGQSSSMYFEGDYGQVSDMFVFKSNLLETLKFLYTGDGSVIRVKCGFNGGNNASFAGNTLWINPTYSLDSLAALGTVRGIYYDPVLSIANGARHIAIETRSGDVLLGTDSGKVGLGLTSPTAQLHTNGSVRFAGLTNDNTQTNIVVADGSGNLYLRDASSLAVNNLIRSSLAVNGTITAKKLTLSAANWPDYVFNDNYSLMPLPQLKEYIHRNNHLPDVTPAAAAEKNGVDVGETQTALLKKIEELTLYTIKQDEEIGQLKKEMADLRKMITDKAASKQ